LGALLIACGACTFENSAFLPCCEVCGTALTGQPFAAGGPAPGGEAAAAAAAAVAAADGAVDGAPEPPTQHASFAASAAAIKIAAGGAVEPPHPPASASASAGSSRRRGESEGDGEGVVVPAADYHRWARLFRSYTGHTPTGPGGADVLPSSAVFAALTDIYQNSKAAGADGAAAGGAAAAAAVAVPHDQLARLWVLADADGDGALTGPFFPSRTFLSLALSLPCPHFVPLVPPEEEWCTALYLLKHFLVPGEKMPGTFPPVKPREE